MCFEVWGGRGSGLRNFQFHQKKVSDFAEKCPIFQAKLPCTYLSNFSSFFGKIITFQHTFSPKNDIVFFQTCPRPPTTPATPLAPAQNLGSRDLSPTPQD